MRDILRTFAIYTAKAFAAIVLVALVVGLVAEGLARGGADGFVMVVVGLAILIGASTTAAEYS